MTKEIGADGSIRYHNSDGAFHREDGPAVIHANSRKEWWLDGERHREDGPALIWADGSESWYINNVYYKFESYVNEIFPNDCAEKTMFIMKWG